MEEFNIYQDIAERTGGDIYIGVVGPVRTGKSTFIKKFMDLLVLPNIKKGYNLERATDELPQSGGGRTIMTTEPKFIPDKATTITLHDALSFRVRLVDCVGYTVPGALGYEDENGRPRMVMTPWFDHEIPFQDAAELGTQRVIEDHATIGLVVTTDGSITDLPRENYIKAEERVVNELKELGKPFLIALNSTDPENPKTQKLANSLRVKYGVPVVPINCLRLTKEDITYLLQEILYEFPVAEIRIRMPEWMDTLDSNHWLSQEYDQVIKNAVYPIRRLRDIDQAVTGLSECKYTKEVILEELNLGEGNATISVNLEDHLFYQLLEEFTGHSIKGDSDLFALVQELSYAKKEYDRVAKALLDVEEYGYGIVTPQLEEMVFDEPELIERGNQFGVKLRAKAPSIHMIRADITTEVTPVVGTEKQCEELIQYLTEEFQRNPSAIWDSDFLGRSLHDLVKEGIQNKLHRMPENAREKLKDTLQKIINEGSGGLICIIL
ncbi:stage IV sporulation protein A [Anoxybacter fermentans]|uniref:Stage IV sporulation protein A n=1 Tax=Anoxybacter fermentans TaxID=1323375 RepID=A0A3Q9HSW7_9FIRM|nr:stage IV sporulation protein A [Anoxybacter fermentans]AZR74825.1 stage IV sporulation protein A [Anoxybacter fermentans]